MLIMVGGVWREPTEEEAASMAAADREAELAEQRRPLTPEEATGLLLREQVQRIHVDDQTALRMADYYPEWAGLIGKTVQREDGEEFRFRHRGKLYKLVPTVHTFQVDWEPGVGTESLYVRIDVEHTGERYDPIPYEGNMELLEGLWYLQDGVAYPCIRDTGNPVPHALRDLVGVYVGNGVAWEPLL